MKQFLKINKWFIFIGLIIAGLMTCDYHDKFDNEISKTFYDTHAIIKDSDSISYIIYHKDEDVSLSIMETSNHIKYVSKTVFHCEHNQATIISLSIYDSNDVLIDHQDIENLFDIEKNSISMIEYEYVCKYLNK